MPTLEKLQKTFLSALKTTSAQEDFFALINESHQLKKPQRLAIYRESMQESLISTLLSTFTVCDQLIGREAFRGLAKRYLQQTPAVSPDLGQYGASFPEFIANFPGTNSLPYLSDMAKWEWLYWQMWQGPASLSLDVTAISNIPESQQANIIFQLPANTVLFSSHYPIVKIWQWHQEQTLETPNFNWENPNNFHLLFRPHRNPIIVELEMQQWQLLQKIDVTTLENFTTDELALLPEFMQQGWLGGINIATTA